jgi:hypothetical protein
MATRLALSKTVPPFYLSPEFGAETDDRNKCVKLTSCNYHVYPLNNDPASCPMCQSGRVVFMCCMKRGWAAIIFKVCRQCAWAKQMYSTEEQETIPYEEQAAHDPSF